MENSTVMETEHTTNISMLEFLLSGALLLVVCAFGIIGNAFALLVLTRMQVKSSMIIFLKHLAVYDTMFLVCKIYLHIIPVFSGYRSVGIIDEATGVLPSSFVIGVIFIVRSGSIWTTVGVSVERYFILRYPQNIKTFTNSRKPLMFNVLIALFIVCYNVPRFLEHEEVYVSDVTHNKTIMAMHKTSFAKSHAFRYWYSSIYIIINAIIPFSSLIYLNACVYKAVRKARKNIALLTPRQKADIKLATTLLCVVTIFIICYTPALVYRVVGMATTKPTSSSDELPHILYFTEGINSAVNFIIYCIVGENFRRTARSMFCPKSFATESKRSDNVLALT